MTDPDGIIDERLDQLLRQADPKHTKQEDFRGRQYDLGLAWVHFPEGRGGLGRRPRYQKRRRRAASAKRGAPEPGTRHFFGLAMAGPTIVTHGSEEHQGPPAAPHVQW